MVDAALAVEANLRLVRARAAARHQVLEHLLGRVLEAALLLERRPAAEVEDAPRERGRAAPRARPLEGENLGARRARLERGRRAGRALADDEHLALVLEARDLALEDDAALRRLAHARLRQEPVSGSATSRSTTRVSETSPTFRARFPISLPRSPRVPRRAILP